MDQETEATLKRILAKDLPELLPSDIEFLKARLSYLGRRSREKFASVLNDETPKTQEEVQEKVEAVQDPNRFPGEEQTDGEDEE